MKPVAIPEHTNGLPCFRYHVEGHEALSAALVAEAHAQVCKNPQGVYYSRTRGETAWHSNSLPHDGARAPLLALIDEVIALRWQAVGWSRDTHPWRVTHLWANVARPGDFTLRHHHLQHGGNPVFGGTYYAQVPEQGGNFVACSPDAGLASWGELRPDDYLPFAVPRWWSVQPQAGDVLLFPAWLVHAVQENRAREDRIAWTFLCEMDGTPALDLQRDRPQYSPLARHPGWLQMVPAPKSP